MSGLRAIFRFLSISVPLLCVSLPVFAEMPADSLPEVVISSTRLQDQPVEQHRVPANITILTQKDIKETGARTIQEVLQYQPGVTVYDNVGNEFQGTVSLRGFVNDAVNPTTVIVDGVRTNTPDFNIASFDLIPIEDIERIEILPGPSALYGKNALGGVINIVTKRGGRQRQATVETAFGSFQRERYTGNTSGSWGKYDYHLGVSRETEDGFRDETNARITRLFGKFGYRPNDLTDLSVTMTHISDRLKQGSSLTQAQLSANRRQNPTPGDFQDSELNKITLDGRRRLTSTLSVALNGFYAHQDSHIFSNGQTSRTRTVTGIFSGGGTLQATHDTKVFDRRNVFVLGGEYVRHDFEVVTARRTSGENVYAFFAQNSFDLTSQVVLTAGARYDWDRLDFTDDAILSRSGFKTYTRATPRAGLTYQLSESASLYGSYSEGFRAPTQNELFALGTFTSNPGLRPVKSRNYEVGGKVKAGPVQGAVAIYQADVTDEIYFTCNVPNCTTFTGINRNVDKTRRRGVEASVKAQYDRHVDGYVNYTFTEAIFRSRFSDFGGISGAQTVEAGDSIPMVPKHLLALGANYHPVEGLTASLNGLYVGTKFLFGDEANAEKRLPGYFLLNARLAYERKTPSGTIGAFVQVNNLLDTKYETLGRLAFNFTTNATEAFMIPAPGTSVFGGLSYRFDSF